MLSVVSKLVSLDDLFKFDRSFATQPLNPIRKCCVFLTFDDLDVLVRAENALTTLILAAIEINVYRISRSQQQ
jgi:hypothetical protein